MENIKIIMNGKGESSGVISINLMLSDKVTLLIEEFCKLLIQKCGEGDTKSHRRKLILERLNEIGIPSRLKGYKYIVTAIEKVADDETLLEGITKILYPDVAKKYNSTPQRVEKAIRHAIEVAWKSNVPENIKKEFDYQGKPRPTNLSFIASVSKNFRY